jgi:Tfp pilus assembly protein PilF
MMGLASVFIQTKQSAKAKELLEKVLKADPENRMAKRMMQNIQQ